MKLVGWKEQGGQWGWSGVSGGGGQCGQGGCGAQRRGGGAMRAAVSRKWEESRRKIRSGREAWSNVDFSCVSVCARRIFYCDKTHIHNMKDTM